MKQKERLTIRLNETTFSIVTEIARSKKITKSNAIEFIINRFAELQSHDFINPIEEKIGQLQTNMQNEFYKVRSMINKSREYAEAAWRMAGFNMAEIKNIDKAKAYREIALKTAKEGRRKYTLKEFQEQSFHY